ncbi:unnamed protein product [Polarella glacialis]|uniref:Uncharacterized protein n=1 Tax=Polarella glacialis TaxID=89957 RepID=A0A813KPB3_POLGL|nr:unnamed protein product [Polarella glacialis]
MGLFLQVLLAWNLVAPSLGDLVACSVKWNAVAGNCSSINSSDMASRTKDFCDAGACRSAAMEANATCSGTPMNSTISGLLSICTPDASNACSVKYMEIVGKCSSMNSSDMAAMIKDVCDAGVCRSAVMEANATCSGTPMNSTISQLLSLCNPCLLSYNAVAENCSSISAGPTDPAAVIKDFCDAGVCRSAAMEADATCGGNPQVEPVISQLLSFCKPCFRAAATMYESCNFTNLSGAAAYEEACKGKCFDSLQTTATTCTATDVLREVNLTKQVNQMMAPCESGTCLNALMVAGLDAACRTDQGLNMTGACSSKCNLHFCAVTKVCKDGDALPAGFNMSSNVTELLATLKTALTPCACVDTAVANRSVTVTRVVGTMAMSVANCTAFTGTAGVQGAVAAGIASASGVAASSVMVALSCPSRRLASGLVARRLADAVNAEYEITIPAGSTTITAASVTNAVVSEGQTGLFYHISTAMTAASIVGVNLTVTSVPVPKEAKTTVWTTAATSSTTNKATVSTTAATSSTTNKATNSTTPMISSTSTTSHSWTQLLILSTLGVAGAVAALQ